jgi:hypothetical protein
MSSETKNIKTSCLTPKLLLKPTSNKPIIATTSMYSPSSSIATGVFYLPIKQKSNRKGSRPKHLRKPPSFDTYLHSSTSPPSTTHRGYMTRTPSLSSSYSSTSSLVDADEEMVYGYGSPKSSSASTTSSVHRHRRVSSAYKVRFADIGDDGSSIVSSSSSVDEWDDMDIDEEEEDYIFVARQSPPTNHYFNYHEKGGST